jgi:predicted 2-oxoglutarate/Fe(II)-dependent dioxygenase YbiX
LSATAFYQEKYQIHEPLFHEPYQALKYQTGTEYKAHYDGNTTSGRFLSAITYLNDDYNGGELEFPNFGVKIKPREGDLVLFPSNYAYAHIAHPVTSGTKYAIVTWIHDRPVEQ